MTHRSKTALFAGTFNPFTSGHLRIVERALEVADRVIIAIGHNINKSSAADIEERLENIRRATARFNNGESPQRVAITTYSGLTAEFAKEAGADFLVRGIRNTADFEYERNLADINLKILGMDTVFFCSEPEYGYLSSSTVRELKANGFDVSSLLPE